MSIFTSVDSWLVFVNNKNKIVLFLARWLASGFGAGYAPLLPGTTGTLVAVALLHVWDPSWKLIVLGLLIGYMAIQPVLRSEFSPDPQWIVWDEIMGMLFAYQLVGRPLSSAELWWLFFFFRFFDMLKPFPIRQIETLLARTDPTLGILLDDLVAAIMAAGTLYLTRLF